MPMKPKKSPGGKFKLDLSLRQRKLDREFLEDIAEMAKEMGLDVIADELLDVATATLPRFVVDKRIGCCAVIDTYHPSFPSGRGLHDYYPEVVRYWTGRVRKDGGMYVHPFTLNAAKKLAMRLSAQANAPLIDKRDTDG